MGFGTIADDTRTLCPDPVRLLPVGADVVAGVGDRHGPGGGLSDGVAGLWLGNWLSSWAVAFPAVLVVAPVTRHLVARLTRA